MADAIKVIVIEDDPAVRAGIEQALDLAGFDVRSFGSAEWVRSHLPGGFAGVVVTDVKLPGMDGLQLLKHLRDLDPKLPVIVITGHGDISMAVQAMRDGAYDFITKPFASEQLVGVVRRAVENRNLTLQVAHLQKKLVRQAVEAVLIGQSPGIEKVRRIISDVAATQASVLINGETGTGKELVARCLHEQGSSSSGHFVALNCGGLPEQLFESEMFGHEAGAFTGAAKRRVGKIEHAHNGTLFLDEIESMPCNLQVKLLRVLQEQTLERLGSNAQVPVNCRVVAATKDDLLSLSEQNRFRSDLYYRLNVVPIDLPPLRERREDIPLLFEHLTLLSALRFGREAPVPSAGFVRQLLAHSWPGNVRELSNVASRFVLGMNGAERVGSLGSPNIKNSLTDHVDQFERSLIQDELKRQNGCVATASQALGIPKKPLYGKLRRYQLNLDHKVWCGSDR
ncbi:two component, sigma54 specific, transcriptional regulator, Fis family [Methylobacterium sp. 4-46]|uniref:sigma-54-dependent transcriptional regulator n=1 Tax=unclassified Methylobacterium TaxID=2615210 RepID=UPI000165C9FA|nr:MULTISPECIES: sigma-54 dependent transcriptional regulator [Methylobacterium]ACA15773.1 two component, sigma54 specific, transcriptional regulator, Fis family [Methylobacterium sp. 4-46]WFT81504.1 sigma-54 dependent transcriptional regulator [Methylobacterium nodulans]